jgi:hypothetical protein
MALILHFVCTVVGPWSFAALKYSLPECRFLEINFQFQHSCNSPLDGSWYCIMCASINMAGEPHHTRLALIHMVQNLYDSCIIAKSEAIMHSWSTLTLSLIRRSPIISDKTALAVMEEISNRPWFELRHTISDNSNSAYEREQLWHVRNQTLTGQIKKALSECTAICTLSLSTGGELNDSPYS